MAGTDIPHVFVVHGDITHLACDAWLLPTDQNLSITSGWHKSLPDLNARLASADLSDLNSGSALAAPLPAIDGEPLIIATAVPLHGFTDPNDLRPALRAYAVTANGSVTNPSHRRARRLFALPFFGTAGGGGANRRGAIFDALHAEARSLAAELDVDFVFVFRDEPSYALAQQRRRVVGRLATALPEYLHGEAKRLAELARAGRLVPFLGAGVSVSAGAPTWARLIELLAENRGLSVDERESILQPDRDPLDQAAYLRMLFDEGDEADAARAFQGAIAAAVRRDRYGLAPALLASLDAEQAITLNYDELFELACADAGRPRRIIPGGASDSERWLLKLHGTVNDPSTIVLTREDYLGFNADRAALSALVKATLMTRHLLFVGFGMRDDHFHEIVHDVRRAVGSQSSGLAATALTLRDDPLHKALWSKHLETVSISEADDAELALAARRLEVFLDVMMCEASDSHSYLLHHDFAEALTPAEHQLAVALRAATEAARKAGVSLDRAGGWILSKNAR